MKTFKTIFFTMMSIMLLSPLGQQTVRAETLCVNPGGTGGCYDSIQAAIDASGAIDTAIESGGDRLAALQNDDGGWDWPLDDGNPANASPPNTVGPIAMGLAQAYVRTGDPDHLAALQNAGTFLLAKTNNFSPSDGYLAAMLDQVLGGTTYTDHVTTNFYDQLVSGTYDRLGLGTLYSTATYVQKIRDDRFNQGIANLAAWDIAMGLVGAASAGASTAEWIAGVKAEIDELDGNAYYDVIGLAGAVYGLAFVGEDFDPTAGEHAAAASLSDLAVILTGYQIDGGGFSWNSNYLNPGEGNETIQETASAILALNEVDRNGYLIEIQGAADYMRSVQLVTGGWENYTGSGENNEITGEALWGHTVVYGAGASIINLFAGTYDQDEANGYDPVTGGSGTSDFNIFVNKSVTIQGVDSSGTPITDYNDVETFVIPKRDTPLGNLSTFFIQADDVTISGLDITAYNDPDYNFKTISVIGENATIKNCNLHNLDQVSCIYMYDPRYNSETNTSYITSYRFEGNYLDAGGIYAAGIRFSSGAGWSGSVANRVINGNTFQAGSYGIEFVGPGVDPWDLYPVGAATITDNSFSNAEKGHVVAWGTYSGSEGYGALDWDGIFTGNTFDKAAITKTPGDEVRYYDSGAFTFVRGIYSAIQRYPINVVSQAGDTIIVAAGTYPEQLTISKPLTINGNNGAVLDGTGLADWTTGVKIKSGNVTFNNIDVTNFTQDGIVCGYDPKPLDNLQNIHITNCTISNIQPGYWGFGIYVGYEAEGFSYSPPHLTTHLDYSGLLIENNEITNTGSSGIVLQSITASTGVLEVKNNYIHDIATNDAIWIDTARTILIENNIIENNLWGIDLGSIADDPDHPYDDYILNGPYGPKDIAIQCNLIKNSTGDGIGLYDGWPGTISINSNTIDENTPGVNNHPAATLDAENNWWGDASGPYDAVGNPGGTGDEVTGDLDYDPWQVYLDPDEDGDGVCNAASPSCAGCIGEDNCVETPNTDQADGDGDTVGDACDNCPAVVNSGQENSDLDTRGDACDNCPAMANEGQEDADSDTVGDACDNCPVYSNPGQEDSYPPGGNGIGDACECEADFGCDGDVDAEDVTKFLWDFGRGTYYDPCTNDRWCYGDFKCDGDVDAKDVSTFLEDFGRGQYSDPCPIPVGTCEAGDWCSY